MKYFILIICTIFCYANGTNDNDQEEVIIEEEGPVIWVGPGFYYGIWFGSEIEYNNWYRDNYHNYHDHHGDNWHHDHDGGHHDHDHHDGHQDHGGGGGHGGGHGGGGHR